MPVHILLGRLARRQGAVVGSIDRIPFTIDLTTADKTGQL